MASTLTVGDREGEHHPRLAALGPDRVHGAVDQGQPLQSP
jgi:hypothetical protein